jgi:putative holliday junction resolvase
VGRIVAIDYGVKRSGIAVTDPEQHIATGLKTVPTNEIMVFLKDYLTKEKVSVFVVGQPKHMNNTDSDSEKIILPFTEALRKQFPDIPVERMDERFTSKIAFQAMIDGGLKMKDRQNKSTIDLVSAVLILQEYIEYRQNYLNRMK